MTDPTTITAEQIANTVVNSWNGHGWYTEIIVATEADELIRQSIADAISADRAARAAGYTRMPPVNKWVLVEWLRGGECAFQVTYMIDAQWHRDHVMKKVRRWWELPGTGGQG